MTITEIDSGTLTTDGSEQVVTTDTAGHTYVFALDTTNLAAGDAIEVRIKAKVLSGGAEGQAYYATWANVQEDVVKYSLPVPANQSIKVTMTRVGGADESYDWALLAL